MTVARSRLASRLAGTGLAMAAAALCLPGIASPAAAQQSGVAQQPGTVLGRSPAPLSLEAAVTTVPLASDGRTIPDAVRGGPAAGRLVLVLSGLRAQSAPGVVYDVFLAGRERRIQVGTINFFNAVARERQADFDVTAAVAELGADKLLLVFAAQGPPAGGSSPVVGSATLIHTAPAPPGR